jgi:hypothetical protein
MHAPREASRSKSILLQSALGVVFFLPLWLAYEYEVSPHLRPEVRLLWDVAVPIGGFVLCVTLAFVIRARRLARARAVASGHSIPRL